MLLVSNWKAYIESPKEAKELLAVAKKIARAGVHTIVIAPPSAYLGFFTKEQEVSLSLAAQDISETQSGAHTGEITAGLLSGMDVFYTILGHSERRAKGEIDSMVAAKTQQALLHKIIPIVCIGEKVRDENGAYLQGLRAQISAIYEAAPQKDRSKIIFAYEPIWAIGKSSCESITPADLREMILYIRKVIGEMITPTVALKVKILYGGSVSKINAKELTESSGVQGLLIGHASIDPKEMIAISKVVE
jgi:triosephosphate isomerase (TIM)